MVLSSVQTLRIAQRNIVPLLMSVNWNLPMHLSPRWLEGIPERKRWSGGFANVNVVRGGLE
jgi:hypothetical protein